MANRFIVVGFKETARRGESRVVYDGPDRVQGERALANGGFQSAGYIANPVWIPLTVPADVKTPPVSTTQHSKKATK